MSISSERLQQLEEFWLENMNQKDNIPVCLMASIVIDEKIYKQLPSQISVNNMRMQFFLSF